MLNKSRKKNIFVNKKNNRENKILSSFDSEKKSTDEFIVKDLGINKKKATVNKKNVSLPKININKMVIISFILLILFTIVFIIKFIRFNAVEMVWKTSVTRGSDSINNKSIRYSKFMNGLMRISNDGATYINDSGEVVYNISYNLKDPIYENNDKYFVIADRNAYEFFIFDRNGLSGNNLVSNPIQRISLSKDGVLYILQSDEENSYINVYRHNGNEVDISIKTTLTSDGMPIDISTSEDGTELLVAYACLSQNDIYSKATYYNFSGVGANANSKRIVGEFSEELKDKFLAKTHFFDNNLSCLVCDKGVYFVSTLTPSKPSIIKKYEFNNMIRSISYNKDYIVFVFENNTMSVYSKNGSLITNTSIDIEYENFYLSDDYIIFIFGSNLVIYDIRGRVVFDRELDMDIQYVAKKKSLLFTELYIGLIDGVECIKFY